VAVCLEATTLRRTKLTFSVGINRKLLVNC
jgi:hypothetical protein